MSEERFYQLLSRKLAGEATVLELNELEDLVSIDRDQKKLYEFLFKEDLNKSKINIVAEQAFALHQIKLQLQGTISNKGLNKKPFWTGSSVRKRSVLGVILLTVVVGMVVFLREFFIPNYTVVTATKGAKTSIQLPDGSTVWLNSDSKIRYKNSFGLNQRDLWLTGEAYFDVKHNAKVPFIIHTNKINIKVLGTEFNVKSYPNDSYVETSLIRGKIDVNFLDRPNEHIIMHPQEKLIINNNQQNSDLNLDPTNAGISKLKLESLSTLSIDNSTVSETAWLDNKVVFDNTSFEEIARVLERKFDVKIIFKNNTVKYYRFTGIFQHEGLLEIIELMKITNPFDYKLNKKLLTIE